MLTLDVFYYLTVGLFLTHELDAVKRHEWRLLPVLRSLPERSGEHLFIWLHIPLFVLLLLGGDGREVNIVRVGFAGFAIIHVGLHWLFRNHSANQFNTPGAWALIVGAGVSGFAYLVGTGLS